MLTTLAQLLWATGDELVFIWFQRSNERKKMSKRLNEEALTYFDECVSLSTFDSSDFSAPEDPLFSSSGATFPVGASALGNGKPSTIYCYDQDSGIHQKEVFSLLKTCLLY